MVEDTKPNKMLSYRRETALQGALYTVNQKKRDILFLTISLANLDRFL